MKRVTVTLLVDEDTILDGVKDTGVTTLDEAISQELGWLSDSGMSVEDWSFTSEAIVTKSDLPTSLPRSDALKRVYVLNCVHETKFGSSIYSSLHPTYEQALAYVEQQKTVCDYDENNGSEYFNYQVDEKTLDTRTFYSILEHQKDKASIHDSTVQQNRKDTGNVGIPVLGEEDIKRLISEDKDLEITAHTNDGYYVYDSLEEKELPVHFPERMGANELASLIHISSDIPQTYQINKDTLAQYLWNSCDKNAFVTLNELVIIWAETEDPESFEPSEFVDSELKRLADECDEYAYELAGENLLGQLWNERNIIIINMRNIVDTARDIAKENSDCEDPHFDFDRLVIQGLLTTAVHELRHLQLDTNPFLPDEYYPQELGEECAVEDYCIGIYENNPVPLDVIRFPDTSMTHQPVDALINEAKSRTNNAPPSAPVKEEHLDI